MKGIFTDLTLICILAFLSENNAQSHPVLASATFHPVNALPVANETSNVAFQTNANVASIKVSPAPEEVKQRKKRKGKKGNRKRPMKPITLEDITKKWKNMISTAEDQEDNCKVKYKFKKNIKTLGKVFKFAAAIQYAARGFVQSSYKVDENSIVIVDKCKQKVDVTGLKTTEYKPNSWITISENGVLHVSFNYANLIREQPKKGKEVITSDTPPTTMSITGSGNLKIFNDNTLYKYQLTKADEVRGKAIDGDVYLKISLTNELTAISFLNYLGDNNGDSLYNDGNWIMEDALDSLTFKHSTEVTFIPSGNKRYYTTYITGKPDATNKFYSLQHLTIVCTRDLIKLRCALLGIATSDVFGVKIHKMSKMFMLFKGHTFPEKLLFQSSSTDIPDISMLHWYDEQNIAKVIINENRGDTNERTDQGIIAGTCFRYRNTGMYDRYDVLVRMCPNKETEATFYLPDLVPRTISSLLDLLNGTQWRTKKERISSWLDRNTELMTIDHVEVSSVPYKQKIVFKAPVINITIQPAPGYRLIKHLAFSRILTSTLEATISQTDFTFQGSGDEKFLGSFGNFELDANRATIDFNLNVRSNRLLMSALQESDIHIAGGEAVKGDYITDFEALKNIALKDLVLTAAVEATTFTFISKAMIGDVTSAKFQLFLHNNMTASCLYKEEEGDLYQLLDTIQEATFFDQTWIRYNKIGVMMSPHSRGTYNNLCSMDSEWRNPTKVGIKIVNLTIKCKGVNEQTIDGYRGCKYLRRSFGTENINVELSGWMSRTEMSVEGKCSQGLKLGEHVTIGKSPRYETIKVIIALKPAGKRPNGEHKEKESYLRIEGKLEFSIYQLKCALVVNGDVIWLKIRPTERVTNVVLFQELGTTVWTVTRGRIQTIWNGSLNNIETASDMFIGTSVREENPISFKKRSLVRQYIIPNTPDASKFYGCKHSTRNVPMRILLKMLGHDRVEGFLSASNIKDLCIANNDAISPWNITNIGILVPPGFSISGTVETDFQRGGNKKNLPMSASFVDRKLELCVVLPVQRWGQAISPDESSDENYDIGDNTETETSRDVVSEKQVVGNGYKCVLANGYGVAQIDVATDGIRLRNKNSTECFKECIKYRKEENTYNGININEATKQCECVKSMRFIQDTNGYQTCFLQPLKMHLVEMYSGRGLAKQGFGPKFCYVLPSDKNVPYSAYMEGYLKTFAFEKENARFDISPSTAKPYRFKGMELEYEGTLFKVARGSMTLKAKAISRDPSDIQFKVDIKMFKDKRAMKEIFATALDTIIQKEKDTFSKSHQLYQNYMGKLNKLSTDINTEIATLNVRANPAKRQFQMDSMNRARAMKAYQRGCAKECGFLQLPGWDVETKCGNTDAERPLSCLKFLKNASVASNVGCISNCEAERVKSNIEAKELHARSVVSGSIVDQDEHCKNIGNQYKKEIKKIYTIALTNRNKVKRAMDDITEYGSQYRKFYQKINTVTSSVEMSDIKDPNCLSFDWKHFKLGGNQKVICVDGFIHNIVSIAYEGDSDNKIDERKTMLDTISGDDVMIEKVLERKRENKQSRLIEEKKKRFAKCMSDRPNKAAKVGKSVRSLPRLNNGDFTIFGKSTTEAFYERSPWVVARKRDMLQNLVHSKETPVPRNISEDVKDNSCSSAKRAASEYNEISKYVHGWVKEHEAAKRALDEIKKQNMHGLRRSVVTSYDKVKNFSNAEGEAFNFWTSLTEAGMKEWADIEDQRLAKYNRDSIPVIRKQIQMAYGNGNSKTFQEFFANRTAEGANALKRANIEVPSQYTFSELGKILVSTLVNGKSLEAISGTIEDAVNRSEMLHKRTLPCLS